MDYTTVARAKEEALRAKSTSTADDALLAKIVTSASRAIDRKATGVPGALGKESDNYFELGEVTQMLNGWADNHGNIVCYARKPLVTSVASFGYRPNPLSGYVAVNTEHIVLEGALLTAYLAGCSLIGAVQISITYTGGLAATVAELPEDFIELVTIVAARFYREAETGLTDAIGVAELSTMIYTKAWPVRVLDMLLPYKRQLSWRYPG